MLKPKLIDKFRDNEATRKIIYFFLRKSKKKKVNTKLGFMYRKVYIYITYNNI